MSGTRMIKPVRQRATSGSADERFVVSRCSRARIEARSGPANVKHKTGNLLRHIADHRSLEVARRHLAEGPGDAPGPNGLRYDDLSQTGWFAVYRAARYALTNEVYRPYPPGILQIPKRSGGYREISLFNVQDRVVLCSAAQMMRPYLELSFGPDCFGGRRYRGHIHAVAKLHALVELRRPTHLVVADIRQAFDHVPHQLLEDVIRYRIGDERVARLVRRINQVRGRSKGIPQGSPLSPLLLDMFLTHHLYNPWMRSRRDLPLLRYVDDLLVACGSRHEAEHSDEFLRQSLLNCGLDLKQSGQETIHDLSAEQDVAWLGYRVRVSGNCLRIRMSKGRMDGLHDGLLDCHRHAHPVRRARDVVRGWLEFAGPTYDTENRVAILDELRRTATQYGFTELPSVAELEEWWREAWNRWQRYTRRARDETRGRASPA